MGNKIIVGCKLPNGLIIEVGKIGAENYQKVRLTGSNGIGGGLVQPGTGFGLTSVDADLFKEWLKKHSWMKPVKEGAIFVHDTMESAQKEATDRKDIKTGLEPLEPAKVDPKKGPTKSIGAFEA